MAIFKHISSIHGDAMACMRYIQNPEKTIAGEQTMNVMRYIQSHSVEDAMSVGYNGCSGQRDVAIEQFRMAEESYRKLHRRREYQVQRITVEQYLESNHRKRLPKRLKPDKDGMLTIVKQDVVAEHLTISFHEKDNPSPALVQEVLDEFMAHPYFKGFYAITNIHWDTPSHRHAHILISNFATDGSRALSLSGTRKRVLRRYLDRICYERGLSIIDSKEARLDPKHAKWLDKVIDEGKVKVWSSSGKAMRKKRNRLAGRVPYGRIDYNLQKDMDALALCRELNIRTPEEIQTRVREIGKQIEQTKKAIAYDERTGKNDRRLRENQEYLLQLNKQYRAAVQTKERVRLIQARSAVRTVDRTQSLDDMILRAYGENRRKTGNLVENKVENRGLSTMDGKK